ncbi:restriction system protein [Kitasatospora sp. MAP12-15]|uniref:restriction endonuclease n=1 Tax=unclassified Kitasatospora TaxID=2633591 RepID=UPI0024767680|nr:restriction endonuclease [Kitasatospora sp. MAP12-44]MDH6113157.1 restriction system protein [Kitasatospora sp. MAP12-44]
MQDSTKSQSAEDRAVGARTGFLAAMFPASATSADPLGSDEAAGAEQPQAADALDQAVAEHARAAQQTHRQTAAVRVELDRLADLLQRLALPVSAMDFETQRRSYEPRPYPAGPAEAGIGREPQWQDFAPAEPESADPEAAAPRRLLDSGFQRELAQARLAHQRALRAWRSERANAADPAEAASRLAHEQAEQARARAVQEYNDSLEECRRAYRQVEPAAVESLLERALAAAEAATPDLPAACRAFFRPLTRTAVLDLDLPPLDLVPSLDGYRLAPDGEIAPVPRAAGDRVADYLRLVSRLALRALQAADAVDTDGVLTGVVLNGWLRGPDTRCLLTVDADRDALARTRFVTGPELCADESEPGVYADAEQDEALLRLRELGAAVSPDPYARVGVQPCATAGAAVPAVGDLSPAEFAGLVRELFTRGGLTDWSVLLRGPSGLVATGSGAPDSALPGRWVVCASRRPGPVGEAEVRTLAEAVKEESAGNGLWLTAGDFTEEALDLVATEEYRRIHLADGAGFRSLAETHLGLPLSVGTE